MLGIFSKELAHPPQELNSPPNPNPNPGSGSESKLPGEISRAFRSQHPSDPFSISFGNGAFLAFDTQGRRSFSTPQRVFCGLEEVYCMFTGSLHNLSSLIRQYGLSKGANEAMLVIEAYRTLRDRGPYPADQVLRDLDGDYGFVILDTRARTVFLASGPNERVRLFWGIAGDGSMVVSDTLEVIKDGCAKSYAPFPLGCMFHSEQGLKSFEHPTRKMKAMPRVDSEGVMCGANFNVDVHSKVSSMPRVGSEANWAMWTQNA